MSTRSLRHWLSALRDFPNVGVLKATGIHTYKSRTPAHLEYIALYCTPKGTKPIIFPVGDFHVKVIFEDVADFPDFIDFLKDANRTLGSTWFTTLRQGGKEHSLFIGKPENERRRGMASSEYHRRAPPVVEGHYILIDGLPSLFNAERIVKRANEAGIAIKRSFWGKNKESELRFIIETTEPVSREGEGQHLLFPEIFFGFNVEYFFTNSVGEWEDTAGTSTLGSFKFLDDASPAILGNLGDLIEKAKKKFHTISEPSVSLGDSEVVVDPSGSNNNRNPDGIQRNPSYNEEWEAVVGKGGGRGSGTRDPSTWHGTRNSRVHTDRQNFFSPRPPVRSDSPLLAKVSESENLFSPLNSPASNSGESSDENSADEEKESANVPKEKVSPTQKKKRPKKRGKGKKLSRTPPPPSPTTVIREPSMSFVAHGILTDAEKSKKAKLAKEKAELESKKSIEKENLEKGAGNLGSDTPRDTAAIAPTVASTNEDNSSVSGPTGLFAPLSHSTSPETQVSDPSTTAQTPP